MHHQFVLSGTGAGTSCCGAERDSELLASSHEAWWAGTSGIVAPIESKPEVVSSFDLVEWSNSKLEDSLDPDAPSKPEANPNSVPVTVFS